MTFELPSEGFLAVAAVGWADQWLRKKEARGLVRAAEAAGLSGSDLERVRGAIERAPRLEELDLGSLGESQSALVYALAVWLARLDGVVGTEELQNLRALRDRLGLTQQRADLASSAAFDVSVLPGGGDVERFDFAALAARLREKLPSLQPPPRSG